MKQVNQKEKNKMKNNKHSISNSHIVNEHIIELIKQSWYDCNQVGITPPQLERCINNVFSIWLSSNYNNIHDIVWDSMIGV